MRIIFLLLTMIFVSCSSEDDNNICVSFDTRQCMGDPWSEEVDRNANAELQSEQLRAYFESQGISVEEISVDLTYHEIVCEACFVCPEGPRIYVEATEAESEKLRAMDLLNYTTAVCPK